MKQKKLYCLILVFFLQAIFSLQAAEKIPSPEEILGFQVVHRAQAHGTFKFLFNSLLY